MKSAPMVSIPAPSRVGSEPYSPHNILDRLSAESTLQFYYEHVEARERQLLRRRLPLARGTVLSVGCGWNPGRHLFPKPDFRLVGVDTDAHRIEGLQLSGRADEAFVGCAGRLGFASETFDVVLYRLVLHHIAFQEPLDACFAEAARLLRPGGALVAIEPGLWHPVGAALALANRAGLGVVAHGTPDDLPLSPRLLAKQARDAGLVPEIHAVTYAWRRLPRSIQRVLQPIDRLGSRPRAALVGHTLLLIARKPARCVLMSTVVA